MCLFYPLPMVFHVSNTEARQVFLATQGLSEAPNRALNKAGLLELITRIGFVQIDSIATVERAHHHILFSRNQTYRREDLTALLEVDGTLFENWTHDAAIIPSAFFVYWKHRFRREQDAILARWRKWRGEGFEAVFDETYDYVKQNGAVLSRDIKASDQPSGGWWNWHPQKTALEYHWRTGRLAIAARRNFQKVYDLTERVLPAPFHEPNVEREDFVDWACRSALERLGFATTGEIAAFWALISPSEAKTWVDAHHKELTTVAIAPANGDKPRLAWAFAGLTPAAFPAPPTRIRVLSPFDPLLRDRKRTERLFGFSYRIEIFVPEPKRQYGYYVFPILEGDRLIGRIDMKAERKNYVLLVKRLWLEKGVRPSAQRLRKLDEELKRLACFTGVSSVTYQPNWLRG